MNVSNNEDLPALKRTLAMNSMYAMVTVFNDFEQMSLNLVSRLHCFD